MQRDLILEKYNGRCAYSGKPLRHDWQVDHLVPKSMGGNDNLNNLVPCQKIVNHYKRALPLELFRTWFLGGLHTRLAKLPKNPRTEKSQKRINYLRSVAMEFGITPQKPFSGKFYFETIQ